MLPRACYIVAVFWMTWVKTNAYVTDLMAQTDGGQEGLHRKYNIVHVINPFPVDNCEEPFCPFDQAQSVTIASMLKAHAKTNLSVLLAAATFPEDAHVVPPEFFQLPYLQRSTASEYPNLTKKLPFLQDIFDSLLESGVDFDYMVFTNTDITVHENFYDIVQRQIDRGLDAFSINRLVIPKARENGALYTAQDLDEIFHVNAKGHPGRDCFVIRRSFVERLQMGDAFLAYPPWGGSLYMQLRADGARFKSFGSTKLNATLHFGADYAWHSGGDYMKQNQINVFNMKRLWCLCEEKPPSHGPCNKFVNLFRRKGFDIAQLCPQTI